jgi:hypothetical protein
MQTPGLSEIKKELKELGPSRLMELCLRMAKYKKENKELLGYLLFEADEPALYIKHVKEEIDLQVKDLNKSNVYYTKKSLRKILRFANKQIKFSGDKQTEAEILIHFCRVTRESGIRIKRYPVLENLYTRQLEKIRKAVSTLHEDLQYDFEKELEGLEI